MNEYNIIKEMKYNITTDKNNKMDLYLRYYENEEISISVYSINQFPSKKYELKCNLEEFQKNRFFKIFNNIEELMLELDSKIEKSAIFEENNLLYLDIPIGLKIINDILLEIKLVEKNPLETIEELKLNIKNLNNNIIEKDNKINQILKQNNELNEENKKLKNEIKNNNISFEKLKNENEKIQKLIKEKENNIIEKENKLIQNLKENNKLKEENQRINEQNKKLKYDFENFNVSFEKLKKENEKIKKLIKQRKTMDQIMAPTRSALPLRSAKNFEFSIINSDQLSYEGQFEKKKYKIEINKMLLKYDSSKIECTFKIKNISKEKKWEKGFSLKIQNCNNKEDIYILDGSIIDKEVNTNSDINKTITFYIKNIYKNYILDICLYDNKNNIIQNCSTKLYINIIDENLKFEINDNDFCKIFNYLCDEYNIENMGVNFDKIKKDFVEYYKKNDKNVSKEEFIDRFKEYIIDKLF